MSEGLSKHKMDLDCISIPPQRPALGVADIGRTTFVELAKRKQDWDLFPSYWILLESEAIYRLVSQSKTTLVPLDCRCKHSQVSTMSKPDNRQIVFGFLQPQKSPAHHSSLFVVNASRINNSLSP